MAKHRIAHTIPLKTSPQSSNIMSHNLKLSVLTTVALPLVLTKVLSAQSVLDLQKDYHVGMYSGSISIPSGALNTFAGIGDLSLTGSGGMTFTIDTTEITPTSSSQTTSTSYSGSYTVLPSSELIFLETGNPNEVRFWIDAEGTVMTSTRTLTNDTEALNIIALEKGAGMSNASMVGDYYFVSQTYTYENGTWEASTEWGLFNFDGLGFATISGDRLYATPAGSSVTPFSGTSSYSVSSDGTLQLDGEPGAVSADGELAFQVLADTNSEEIGWTIAVKIGSSYNHNDVVGRYGSTGHSIGVINPSNSPNRPRTTSGYGEVFLDATSSTAGTMQWDVLTIDGTGQAVSGGTGQWSGTTTLGNQGILTYLDGSIQNEFAASSSGRYIVGRFNESNPDMSISIRVCPESRAYGVGTAGTGNETPELGMKTFPTIGNANWALTVEGGVGSGIGVVALAAGDAPGLAALGGQIWIDPLTVGFSGLLVLGGAPGSAAGGAGTVSVPLPNNPSIAGFRLFGQAVIIDAGGPQGFSMSKGFEAVVCQ